MKHRRKVHTHTFNGTKYDIDEVTSIEGICDNTGRRLTILRGNTIAALGSALEEGLHALNIPDEYLHKPKRSVPIGRSLSKVDDLARFIWRLGYRRVK